MDEKEFLARSEKIQKELEKYTDDKIFNYVMRKGSSGYDKFIKKMTKLAKKHIKLRNAYDGEMTKSAETRDYMIERRLREIEKVLGEIKQMGIKEKKIPPPIPKKSEAVKKRYAELMMKPKIREIEELVIDTGKNVKSMKEKIDSVLEYLDKHPEARPQSLFQRVPPLPSKLLPLPRVEESKKERKATKALQVPVQQAVEILADWEKSLSPQQRAKLETRIKKVVTVSSARRSKAEAKQAEDKKKELLKKLDEMEAYYAKKNHPLDTPWEEVSDEDWAANAFFYNDIDFPNIDKYGGNALNELRMVLTTLSNLNDEPMMNLYANRMRPFFDKIGLPVKSKREMFTPAFINKLQKKVEEMRASRRK